MWVMQDWLIQQPSDIFKGQGSFFAPLCHTSVIGIMLTHYGD